MMDPNTDPTRPYQLFYRGPFSQWYKSTFYVDGIKYTHAEQWMMAEKARLFNDKETLAKILAADNPRKQKKLGREVRGFKDGKWKSSRLHIVVKGNLAKFSQDKKLKEMLLKTGDRIIVEASPVDTIWGIGLRESDPRAQDMKTWRGLNLLGEALMRVRKVLREEDIEDKLSKKTKEGSNVQPSERKSSTSKKGKTLPKSRRKVKN
ncbi:hypothetical protein AAMO2058_000108700 [Amorphochlora amoebiformis]